MDRFVPTARLGKIVHTPQSLENRSTSFRSVQNGRGSLIRRGQPIRGTLGLKPRTAPLGQQDPGRPANTAMADLVTSVNSHNSSAINDENSENQENSSPFFAARMKTPAQAPTPLLNRSISAPLSASSTQNVRAGYFARSSRKKRSERSSNKRPMSLMARRKRLEEENHIVAVVSPAVSDQPSAVSSASPIDRSLGGSHDDIKSVRSVGTAADSLASPHSLGVEQEEDNDLGNFHDTRGDVEVEFEGTAQPRVRKDGFRVRSEHQSLPSPSDSQAFLRNEEMRAVDSPMSDEEYSAGESDDENESENSAFEETPSEAEEEREQEDAEEEEGLTRPSLVTSIVSVASPPTEGVVVKEVKKCDSVRRASETPVPRVSESCSLRAIEGGSTKTNASTDCLVEGDANANMSMSLMIEDVSAIMGDRRKSRGASVDESSTSVTKASVTTTPGHNYHGEQLTLLPTPAVESQELHTEDSTESNGGGVVS